MATSAQLSSYPKASCFNGRKVVSSPEEKYLTFLHLAEGTLSEDALAAWFENHSVALENPA